MVTSAVIDYADNHDLAAVDALNRLKRQGALAALRANYNTLHTQSLSESEDFVEDYMRTHANG
jgi:hypothetical protein